jgi:hypothetical protein
MTAAGIYHAPGDWIVRRTTARDRRSLNAWLLIIVTLTVPLRFEWKDAVWMVWALSEVAILISLFTNVSAETPVEHEAG